MEGLGTPRNPPNVVAICLRHSSTALSVPVQSTKKIWRLRLGWRPLLFFRAASLLGCSYELVLRRGRASAASILLVVLRRERRRSRRVDGDGRQRWGDRWARSGDVSCRRRSHRRCLGRSHWHAPGVPSRFGASRPKAISRST